MRSTAFTVRRLGADHLAPMDALLDLFGEAFVEPESYGAARPGPDYLARLLGRPDIFVMVAERDSAVVGGLVAYELMKFERARSEVYIYDLAVAAPHRRRGVATALIEALRVEAAARGAWVIFVQADPGDDPAIALYESLGTRESVLHFDIAVEPPGTLKP